MITFKNASDRLSRESLESEVPARYLHNGIVINRDGSFGIVFGVQFPYLTTASDNQRLALMRGLAGIMNTLDEKARVQFGFFQHNSPLQLLDLKRAHLAGATLIDDVQVEHLSTLEQGLRSTEIRYYQGIISLVCDPPVPLDRARSRMWEKYLNSEEGRNSGWIEKIKRRLGVMFLNDDMVLHYTEEEWNDAVTKVCAQGDQLEATLTDLGLQPEFLSGDELVKLFYNFWNPFTCAKGGMPIKFTGDDRPLTDYFLRSDLDTDPAEVPNGNGIFRMDQAYHQILTLRVPGEVTFFGQWERLVYYSGVNNLRIMVNSRPGNRAKRIDRLKTKLSQMENKAEKEPELVPAIEEIRDEIFELGKQSGKVWEVTVIVHVWDESYENLMINSQRLIQIAETDAQMQLTLETDAALEYWRAGQPAWTRDLDRNREITLNTNQLAAQIPACGEPHGLERKRIGAIAETASGSIHNYYPHDDSVYGNFNAICIGGTRTGKTFNIQQILLQLDKLSPVMTMVDIGGSFKGLCEVLGGNYIQIDLESDMHTINPLFLGDNSKFTSEDVERTKRVIEQMLIERQSNTPLSSAEMNIVEESLFQVFQQSVERGQEAILSEFRDVLQNHGSDGTRLANRLNRYCGDSGKGKLFDGRSKLDTRSRITVYDLTKCAEDKEITPLMFQILINNVIRTGMEDLGALKFLIFDEVWKFLAENDKVADFVEYAFRGLAKFNFATVAITQGIEELASIKNSQAILNNTSQRFIFRQESPQAARQAAEILDLNEREESIIKDLRSELGLYSQCLHVERLRSGNSRSTVLMNRTNALSHAICTTQGRDQAMRQQFIREGMSLREAILKFAELYPHGVSQAEINDTQSVAI